MNKERQKVRNAQHGKLNAVKNLHDEMKELQEKEVEALRAQMLRVSAHRYWKLNPNLRYNENNNEIN